MLLAPHSRVVVAMSGGIDSSVVAALLKEQGHQVIGVTLEFKNRGVYKYCISKDLVDAARIAAYINIPHYILNCERLFRESVIMPFIDAYYHGRTPIPCVLCNKVIKFQYLLDFADFLGADYLATGHYARKMESSTGPELWRSHNKKKDQSYFLFTITRTQLQSLYFPLGEIGNKMETRAHARRLNLPEVLSKKDSQDICFVPDGDYRHVVSQYKTDQLGEIVHIDGYTVGQHLGITSYTIGQRKGLGISSSEPMYVLHLKPDTKQVIVGPYTKLLHERLTVREINWIGPEHYSLLEGKETTVQLRSMCKPSSAVIYGCTDNIIDVLLEKPTTGIVPGQACVFYHGDLVLGGGWIV